MLNRSLFFIILILIFSYFPVIPEDAEIPSAPELEDPMTEDVFYSQIISLVSGDQTYVRRSGLPMGIVHDLDKNGYKDFLLLTVKRNGFENREFIDEDDLGDSGRLFYERKEYFHYSILIFYQYPGEIVLRYTVPLSRQLVLNDFRVQEIRRSRDFPFGVSVSFKTLGGTREEWVILYGQGISTFMLEETLSVIPVVDDIDNDGFIDIVIHQQAAEEGIGYETFLTWYKWNGSGFIEEKSSNIVRNLRKFLTGMADIFLSGEKEAFLDFVLFPETREKLSREGMSLKEIFSLLFKPVEGGVLPVYDLEIKDVIYPVLMETPFTYENRGRFEFPITIGIITEKGGYYFRARLAMGRNPFGEKQFGFLPVAK